MDCSTAGFPVLHYLLEFVQVHVHWISDAIQPFILCHPLLLLLSIFPSTGSQLNILFPLQDGLPWWLSWSRICLQCRRQGFDCWVGKICGVGNGNPWTEENSMDRGAWQATVYGVAKSWTQLSNKHATGWKQEKLKNKAGTTTWQLRQSLESSS